MSATKQGLFAKKPRDIDVLLFTRHLATLIHAGITVIDALETLSEQTENTAFREIIDDVRRQIENGQPISKALRKHPKVFDDFYVSLMEVSEQSGSLDENLDFIAKQLIKKYRLKKKIQGAALYPSFVLIAVVIMGGFVSLFVLPQLVDFFEAFDTELPIATQILLYIATLFKEHGLLIWAGIISFLVLFRATVKTDRVRPYWHKLILMIPIIGPFIAQSEIAQFSRNLGILMRSGVPILEALDVTLHTLSNEVFKKHVRSIRQTLEKGKSIGEALSSNTFKEFPPLVSKMIAVGEKTGKLDESLLYLGDFYEEEIDDTTKNLSTVLEPILLITIGLVVGFMAIAIITPIYELTGSIQK